MALSHPHPERRCACGASLKNYHWNAKRCNKCRAMLGQPPSKPIPRDVGYRKLRPQHIPIIRQRWMDGEIYREIAKDYGVTPGAIGQVICGKTWKGF